MMSADTQNFSRLQGKERLPGWHASLFSAGYCPRGGLVGAFGACSPMRPGWSAPPVLARHASGLVSTSGACSPCVRAGRRLWRLLAHASGGRFLSAYPAGQTGRVGLFRCKGGTLSTLVSSSAHKGVPGGSTTDYGCRCARYC